MQTRALRFCLELSFHCKDSGCIEAVSLCHGCLLLILLLLVNNVCQEINACKWVNDKIATSV